MRAIALTLALALVLAPALARADDPPGRAVELAEGQLAPYTGSLVDRDRMAAILAKRRAAELLADARTLEAQQAQADRDAANARAAKAESRPAWAVVFAVGAGCLVAGVAGGVALVYAARK